MKAMILAAGRGTRMRPLTDHLPKPLLSVAGQPLLVHHLQALAKADIKEIIINISYQAEKIQTTLGDGQDYGVKIHYSFEPSALETGGGILQALPQLGSAPFLVISGDIWTDYPLQLLPRELNHYLAHLVMVNNPTYHPAGDFVLKAGELDSSGEDKLTFANIGVYQPQLFQQATTTIFPLVDVLQPAIKAKKISGEHYQGDWVNVGTPAELQSLAARFES